MVEHHLAKVRVAGSNPVFRSRGRRGQVVKAGVCKTPIHGFESHRRLHKRAIFNSELYRHAAARVLSFMMSHPYIGAEVAERQTRRT